MFNASKKLSLICLPALVILQLSCGNKNKQELSEATDAPQLSPSNTAEYPLSEKKDQQNARSATVLAGPYFCSNNFSGTYSGNGYYAYENYTVDLNGTQNGSLVTLLVSSLDVPNRFTLYDAEGRYIKSTDWLGYANYPGPWGQSLNGPQNGSLTFIKGYPHVYNVRVETLTKNNSDYWSTSVSCTNTGYSGQDLFKALYFFDGDAASRLPSWGSIKRELTKFSPAQEAQRQAFNNEMISIINNLNPNFMERFRQQIYSQDLDAIDAVMDEGAALLEVAVINSSYNQYYQSAQAYAGTMDLSQYDFETEAGVNAYLRDYGNKVLGSNSVKIPEQGFGVFFAAVVAVAVWDAVAVVNYGVVVNAAAVAVVWAAVYAKVAFWGLKPAQPKPKALKLVRDNLINDIYKYISRPTIIN